MKFTSPLTKNYEFKRLYNKGKSLSSSCVVVYCRRNGSNENRLGITVSAKVGNAVQRNRIRRRFKEIYRLNEDNLASGFDIVIVARVRARLAEYKELEGAVLSLMKKLNLIPRNGK
jgi:ribonuclease P protein component